MIISDLNYLEVVSESAAVQGGWSETDTVSIAFDTTNKFTTIVVSPTAYGNSAAAGAKAVADPGYYCGPLASFTKADTLAVTTFGGGSFSASTSVAVINPMH